MKNITPKGKPNAVRMKPIVVAAGVAVGVICSIRTTGAAHAHTQPADVPTETDPQDRKAPTAPWIGMDEVCWDWRSPALPAPTYRGRFEIKETSAGLRLAVCGLGYFDCRLDGRPVSDALLVPGETQYDIRWRYRVVDLPVLSAGRHVLTITCGDGLYRATSPDVWHFDKATWADYPKVVCELRQPDGTVLFRTDPSWQWRPSATVFTAFRGGETYDARKAAADDATDGWLPVRIVAPPGGFGEEERFPPCRVTQIHAMTNRVGTSVWEAPFIMTGNVRLTLRGTSGSQVTVVSAERLSTDGRTVDQRPLDFFDIGKRKTFQRDTYILSGEGSETWSPRFTYHGFRFAELQVTGTVEIVSVEGLEIYNDFPRIGRLTVAPTPVLRVANACERSILGNFHNIPTDCPTREKNGWTSEGRIMCEATLYSFDAGSAYSAWADLIGDTQRRSGQISSLAPCNGWGYNWGSGPAWDTALLEVPDAVYRFTGDRSSIERLYPKIVRYLDFVEGMLDADGVPSWGLGDWLSASGEEYERLVRAGFRIRNLAYGVRFARLLGKESDMSRFESLRQDAVRTFRRLFCDSDGLLTAATSFPHALMLDLELVEPSRRSACVQRLADAILRNGARVDYGTLGSRCVLRMLFEHGHPDLAWRLMTQPECPGYVFLTDTLGMTTLPERWDPHIQPERHGTSLNHGAFADYLAVCYRHLGGIRHTFDRPGRDFVEIRPSFPRELQSFACEHEGYKVSWRRESGRVLLKLVVPPGKRARYVSDDGHEEERGEGTWVFP